jgi:aminopeptidase YwaD
MVAMRFCPISLSRLIFLWSLWIGCLLIQPLQAQLSTDAAANQVLVQARADLAILCSDSLAGRGYTADGHRKAARYIAQRMQQIGLQPCANYPNYLQPFSFPLNLIRSGELKLKGHSLKIGADYIVWGGSGKGQIKAKTYSLGYGRLVDYQAATGFLKGKCAFIYSGPDPQHQPTNEEKESLSTDEQKIARAIQLGAAAVVLIADKLTALYSEEPVSVPVMVARRQALKRIPKKVQLSVDAEPTTIQTQNIVGLLPGKNPSTDSLIILGAHYDHLGKVGDAIFYGANDNASGVSFLLGMAHQLAQKPLHNHTVVFVAFSGEEAGLHGSFYYASNLQQGCASPNRIKYMLNFDLLANGEEGVMAVGGKTFPQLFQPLKAMNDSSKAVVSLQSRTNVPNSDHYPFTLKQIPALFFYTMGGPKHYHDIYDRPEAFSLTAFYPFMRLVGDFMRR